MSDSADEEVGDATTQSGLDHRSRNEKGCEHQPDYWVSITTKGFANGQCSGDGEGRDTNQNHRTAWYGPQNRSHDCGCKNGQQSPRLHCYPTGNRSERYRGAYEEHYRPPGQFAQKLRCPVHPWRRNLVTWLRLLFTIHL